MSHVAGEIVISIAAKKKRLDELRPLSTHILAGLEHYYDIELTFGRRPAATTFRLPQKFQRSWGTSADG